MIANSLRTLFFLIALGFCGQASSEDAATDSGAEASGNAESTEAIALVGDFTAGEERYKQSCINCHGAAGKGVASYPKVSGQEISYTREKLRTYRDGIKIGPNSSLMIMMARPLTDEEIEHLATYLKEVTP